VATVLRKLIDEDKSPLSPRLKPLKSALSKIDPPKPKPPPREARNSGFHRTRGMSLFEYILAGILSAIIVVGLFLTIFR
jgi:hypothetical protein